MEYIIKASPAILQILPYAEQLNERYYIADLQPGEADLLMLNTYVEYIEPAELVFPFQVTQDQPEIAKNTNDISNLTGQGVIIGIIDSGINASLPLFKFKDGASKIISVWDLTQPGTPPEGFKKGGVVTGDSIFEITDPICHGTAVAGVAARVAPGARLIIVKLSDKASRTTDIMRGVSYITNTAMSLGKPCVINISYGTNLGSHNGESLFESYLDDASGVWKNLIVCATGNEGDAAHHSQEVIKEGETTQVDFSIGTVLQSIYIDVWSNFVDDILWSLTSPNGKNISLTPLINPDSTYYLQDTQIEVIHRGPTQYSTNQETIFSFRLSSDLPQGNWRLSFYGETIVSGRINLWLPTVEEVGKRTAFLLPSSYLTASIPSTSGRTVAVGGYNDKTNTISTFSGRGPEDYTMAIPDIVAPAEAILSTSCQGGFDYFTGTSVAAPAVTGTAALMMEWGIVDKNDPFLYGQRIRAFLRRYASRQSNIDYPNPTWGYGSLNIQSILNNLSENRRRGGIL